MAHIHSVYDTDKHFTIDPATRVLVNQTPNKSGIMQFDHNSERITFDLPAVIEGHKTLDCNRVEVHYLNIDAQTKEQKKGLYEVTDLQVSPEDENVAICSWLISQNATQLIGPLYFRVTFKCVSDPKSGEVDYIWSTAVYKGLSVSDGINNSDWVAEEYVDVLEQWRQELIDTGGVTDDRIEQAVANYMAENPDSSQNADLSTLTLGVHTDGLVYIFLDGEPIGDGMDISGGSIVKYGEIVVSLEKLAMSEGGSATVDITLSRAPSEAQAVYLAVADSTLMSVEPATLTFTPDNWNVPQTVTVTALQDEDQYDGESAVSLTSKTSEKIILVTVSDDDKVGLVTDGLVLNMDYTGHVGDESDTITDLASGVSFKNFSKFTKVENGIRGEGGYAPLLAISDDAKTAFVNKLKETGAFSLELFGTCMSNCFFYKNEDTYIVGTGAQQGWNSDKFAFQPLTTNPIRILQDGSTDTAAIGKGVTYTINGESKGMQYHQGVWPYRGEFMHCVMTYAENGDVTIFLNGVRCDSAIPVENFKEWDFDTMFGGSYFGLVSIWKPGDGEYTSAQRIYNRVLTADEVTQNMRANAKLLGLETF